MVSSGHRPILAFACFLAVVTAALVLFWASSDSRPTQAKDNFDLSFVVKNCNGLRDGTSLHTTMWSDAGIKGQDTTPNDGVPDCLQAPAVGEVLTADTVTDQSTFLCIPGRLGIADCPLSGFAEGAKNFSSVVNYVPTGYQIAGAPGGLPALPVGTLVGGSDNVVKLAALSQSNDCSSSTYVGFLFYNIALPDVGIPSNPGDPRTSSNIAFPRNEGQNDRFGAWQVGSPPPNGGANNIVDNTTAPVNVADPTSLPITNYPSFLLDLFDPDFTPGGPDGPLAPIVPIAVYGGLAQPVPASTDWVPLYFVQFAPGALKTLTGNWVAPHPFSRTDTSLGSPNLAVLNDPSAVKASKSTIQDFCSAVLSQTMLKGTTTGGTRYKTPVANTWRDPFTNNTGTTVNDLHLVFDTGKLIKKVISIAGGNAPDTWTWQINAEGVNTPSDCAHAADNTVDITATGGTTVPNGGKVTVLVQTCAAQTALSATAQWTLNAVNTGSTFVVPNEQVFTYLYENWVMSLRDKDGDGRENSFDTCPNSSDGPGVAPFSGATEFDQDGDGLYNSCDADPGFTGGGTVPCQTPPPPAPTPTPVIPDPCTAHVASVDADSDFFDNRQDNCPLNANGLDTDNGAWDNQKESELGVVSYAAVAPDGGPKTDGMGDACEAGADDTLANGEFQVRGVVTPKCIGGTDADKDGYCVEDKDAGFDAAAGTNAVKHALWTYPLIGATSGDTDQDTLGIKSDWQETYMGLDGAKRCARDTTISNEPLPDRWSFDMNDDRKASLSDILSYIAVYNFATTTAALRRFDQDQNGVAGLSDILSFIAVYNFSCVLGPNDANAAYNP